MGFYIRIIAYAVLAALVFDFVASYRKTEGTCWQKLLGAGKTSASVLSARVAMIGGLGLDAIVQLADIVANPAVKAMVDQYINAKAVGYTMIACAFIQEWSRRRTLKVPLLGTSGEEK